MKLCLNPSERRLDIAALRRLAAALGLPVKEGKTEGESRHLLVSAINREEKRLARLPRSKE